MVLWKTEVAYVGPTGPLYSVMFVGSERASYTRTCSKPSWSDLTRGASTKAHLEGMVWWIGDVVSFFKAQESTVIRKAFLCRIQRWHDKGLPGHQWLCGMNCIVLVGETLLKAIWVSKIQKGERQREPAFIKRSHKRWVALKGCWGIVFHFSNVFHMISLSKG